jgi:hypothetical protein
VPGPVIVSTTSGSGGAVTSTSLTSIRRALAWRVGPFAVVTTTTAPTGPDALRSVISTTLRDPVGAPGKFDNRYAYITTGANAGQSSRVFPGGFDGPSGTVMLSQPFLAELPVGSSVELLGPLPAVSDGDLFGLNDAIRLALFQLTIMIDMDLTAVAQQIRYPTTSFPWTLRREDIVGVYRPLASGYTAAQSYPQMLNPGSWDFEYDGEAPYLVIPQGFTAGETFFVRVKRPAATWVRTAGTWGGSTTGPVNETDEVAYDAEMIAAVALPICLERLIEHHRGMGEPAMIAHYEQRLAETQLGAAMTRWFRGYRGNGKQRVGAGRDGYSWGTKGWW